jgi:hypothetical protein
MSLNAMPLMRYCFFYFGVNFVSLFQLNNRPVYTQSNIGLYHSIHRDHIILGEMNFGGGKSPDTISLIQKGKFTDYGTNKVMTDRFFLEIIFYMVIVLLSCILNLQK